MASPRFTHTARRANQIKMKKVVRRRTPQRNEIFNFSTRRFFVRSHHQRHPARERKSSFAAVTQARPSPPRIASVFHALQKFLIKPPKRFSIGVARANQTRRLNSSASPKQCVGQLIKTKPPRFRINYARCEKREIKCSEIERKK